MELELTEEEWKLQALKQRARAEKSFFETTGDES
jgi:hypothetical protein